MLRIPSISPLIVALVAWLLSPIAFAENVPGDEEKASMLHRALAVAGHDRWDEAEATIQETRDQALIDFVRWRRLLDRDGQLTFDDYRRFLDTNPDWPLEHRLRVRAEETLHSRLPPATILAFFEDQEAATVEGALAQLAALSAKGDDDRVEEIAPSLWHDGNFSVAQERAFLRDYGTMVNETDHIERLDRLLWQGEFRAAQRMTERVPLDHAALAEARMRLRRAARGVDAAIERIPAHLKSHPGLVYERSRWRRLKGRTRAARELLLEPLDPGYGAELFWRERHWHLRERIGEEDFRTAYRLAAAHGQSDGVEFAEGEWLAGWLALRFLDQPETAAAHFESLYKNVRSPISLARAAYWRGRAAADLDDGPSSVLWYERAAMFPTTFYGQLANEKLGRELTLDATEIFWTTPAIPSELPPALHLAHKLCALGATTHANIFANHHLGNHDNPNEAVRDLVALADACGRPDILVRQIRRNTANGAINPLASFPIPEFEPFWRESTHPEPALVLAIGRQESLFDQNARSHSGALGMMQFIPPTGKAVSRAIGESIEGNRLIVDPAFNVDLSRIYLDSLFDRFDGNRFLTVASYNAGPHRVSQWLRVFGPFEGRDKYGWLDWLERIPFSETRNYVQRVMEGYTVYQELLKQYPQGNLTFVPHRGPFEFSPKPKRREETTS